MHLTTKTKSEIKTLLQSMPFEEARNKILRAELGYDPDSPSYNFCLSWLQGKEADLRDEREAQTLKIASNARSDARLARKIATISAICTGIIAIMAIVSNMSRIIEVLKWVGILKP